MQSNEYVTAQTVIEKALEVIDLEDIGVMEAIEKYLYISDTSGVTKFRTDIVPYMIKPILACFDRRYSGVAVVAPARSAKSKSLIEGVTFYRAWQQPTDMLIAFATETTAQTYSKKEYSRMVKATEPLKKLITNRAHDQGIVERVFRNDSRVYFRSGTNDAFSALGYGLVIITDYDRAPDDGTGSGDSEGSKFHRGLKRTLQSGSSGKCVAESSPSRMPVKDQSDLKPHELPRSSGITGIYNDGTRQMYYWLCPNGDHWLMATQDYLIYDPEQDVKPVIRCPHCGHDIQFHERRHLVGDYMFPDEVDKDGIRHDAPHPNTTLATFHFDGVVAAFNTWESMMSEYYSALNHYERTGDESKLQAYENTTRGRPYVPKLRETDLTIDMLMERPNPNALPQGIVPEDTRFLIATVDVQGGANSRFDVQVTAVNEFLQWQPVDGFQILVNPNREVADVAQRIKPHVYPEDWICIYEQVMLKEYKIAGHDKTIIPAFSLCDSGGSADDNGEGNTTFNAYNFVRYLQGKGVDNRFMLLKGNPRAFKEKYHDGWTKVSFPDSEKDHPFAARKDIPLLNLNSNVLKNTVYTSLKTEGTDERLSFRAPLGWAGRDWYESLLSEEIDDYGRWEKHPHKPNENFDHAQYLFAAMYHLGVFAMEFDKCPPWARAIDQGNSNVSEKGQHSLKPKQQRRRRAARSGDRARWL
ncbi:phage terminase large subunit family protein [Vibrio brasiliensis]|uniref:terminase gpA endonuclease subunit n=1 Tax=Vibrio brasiliensis TaxID=170652 RepID=UPI001EFE2410|nr:terminase gpA endonuclease subunit [Vibrio brasiliensis]MCG9785403.1 phage terminase large subunit family protein [Vibrio brasiliensis]